MTTITIDLPDDVAAALAAKAEAWKMTLDEMMHEAAVSMALYGENPREMGDLSDDEIEAFRAAQIDLEQGKTVSHEEAMSHFRAALAR